MARATPAAEARSALAPRWIVKAGGVGLVGVALAAFVGAGQSAAQYPTGTTSTPTGTTTMPAAATNTVTIKGSAGSYRFSPRKLTIAKGKRVKWSWSSDAVHNVTFHKLHKHSKTKQDGSYRLTFRDTGTYRYLCTIHGFTGKVVVK